MIPFPFSPLLNFCFSLQKKKRKTKKKKNVYDGDLNCPSHFVGVSSKQTKQTACSFIHLIQRHTHKYDQINSFSASCNMIS